MLDVTKYLEFVCQHPHSPQKFQKRHQNGQFFKLHLANDKWPTIPWRPIFNCTSLLAHSVFTDENFYCLWKLHKTKKRQIVWRLWQWPRSGYLKLYSEQCKCYGRLRFQLHSHFQRWLRVFVKMDSFNSTSNDSQSVLEAPCYRYDKHWVRTLRISSYVVIFLFAVIGNTVVLAVVYRNKTMRKTINFFIANMAFSDLIFTVISVPRVVTIVSFGYKWLVHGTLGMIFCRMVPFVMEITIIVSVLTIVAISLERLLAVLFPLRTFIRKKPCLLSIFGMWLIAIIVKIPTPLATDVHPFQGETYCVVDFDLTFGAGQAESTSRLFS